VPRLNRTFPSNKQTLDQKHENELEGITEAMQTGKRCKHTAVRLHGEGKKAITALNLSRLYIYCRTLFLNADFSTVSHSQGVLACQQA